MTALILPPVAELVPHEPPMLLIDELVEWTPDRAKVRAQIRPADPLVQDGRAPALVLLEIMAQAAAATAGMEHRQAGRPIRRGVLLGTRELELEVDSLAVGDVLVVCVDKQFDDGTLAQYRCTVERGDRTIACAGLNVMMEGT